MRKKLLGALAALIVVAAVVAFFVVRSLDDQTETVVSDVLREYREAAAAAQPDRQGLPAQGVYEYTVTGREKITRGLTIERTLPDRASMIVLHRPGGYDTDTRYSLQHTEDASYELTARGALLTKAITTISAGPVRTVRDRAWTPKLLRFPAAAPMPAQVSGDYTAGSLSLKVAARALPDAPVEVDGRTVTARVYRFSQDVTGEYTGTRTETFWYDPATALVLRYTIDSTLEGPTDLEFVVDQTLTSLTPRT